MLTFFTTAKPFHGHDGIIQRNALRSWTLLHPEVEVNLFGSEEGAAQTAKQLRAMRRAMDLCDAAIFTVPMENLSWMKSQYTRAIFIPVGATLPVAGESVSQKGNASGGKSSIAVFGVTGGSSNEGEIRRNCRSSPLRVFARESLRLTVLGRNSKETENEIAPVFGWRCRGDGAWSPERCRLEGPTSFWPEP